MDVSKINQTELSYNSTAGKARVNLFTGRLFFEHQDASIGLESYGVTVSHIYNSQLTLPDNETSKYGNKWKLNIQQFIYKEEQKYYYLDGSGMKIEFKLITSNTYFDTVGLGMKLIEYIDHVEILDISGNLMHFENNRLTKTVSVENISIIKKINYKNDKIVSMYDSRKPDTKYVFSYDNELLDEINVYIKNNLEFSLKYYYEQSNLVCISKVVDGFEKKYIQFKYNNSLLEYAVSLENGGGFYFDYSDNKISFVKIGVAKFNKILTGEKYNSVDNDFYVGENNYLGDKTYTEKYLITGGIATLGDDLLTFNKIIYKNNCTEVTNEKNIKLLYYLNEQGYTSSILEANNCDSLDLRTLKKMSGYSMLNENGGTYPEKINTQKSFVINTADVISTNNLMNGRLESLDYYRGNVCPNYVNYIVSFWVKLLNNVNNSKVKLSVVSKKNTDPDVGYTSIDTSMVNGWQEVRIPIKISYDAIESVSLEFMEKDSTKEALIADMKLYYSSTNRLMLTDGVNWGYLDDVTKISYKTVDNVNTYFNMQLNEDIFITEKDLQMTYMSLFKLYGNSDNTYSYPLYYCDGTKQIMVTYAALCIGSRLFPIRFNNDTYTNIIGKSNTRAQYYTETLSPDGNVYIYNIPHYVKNFNIDGKLNDVIMDIMEGNRYVKFDENGDKPKEHRESYKIKCIDTKGKLLLEQDEYGVQVIYKYDSYGVLSEKKITNLNDPSQTIVFTKTTSQEKQNINDNVINKDIYFDGQNITKIEVNGNNDIQENVYEQTYNYDMYNEKIRKVEDNNGGNNFITYDKCGRIIEVSPMKDSEYGKYSYKFKYDKFGDPTKFFYSYGNAKFHIDNLLIEKVIDRNNGKVTTKYYRSDNEIDEVITKVDEYGRIIETDISGQKVIYHRDTLWESFGASNVNKIVDNIEGKTYNFSYDDFYNLKEYGFKNNDESEMKITKEAENSIFIEENFPNNDYLYSSTSIVDLEYDEDIILNGRVKKTNHQMYYGGKGNPIAYEYDGIGRIKQKRISIYEGFSVEGTSITEEKNFKNKTGQLLSKNIYLDNTFMKDTTIDLNIGYDHKGNISEKEIYIKCKNDERTYKQKFEYNIANQLIKETNERFGIEYEYGYNQDGSIDFVKTNGIIKNYVYDETGRLSAIRESETRINLSYDNLGNVLSCGSSNYSWTRGNLLESYINSEKTSRYYYNGFRKKYKKVLSDGTVITYNYDNGKLISENRSNGLRLRFMYDLEGVTGMIVETNGSGSLYYFIKDEQGSVISILNNDLEIVHYEYDSFGNCSIVYSTNDYIAELNPIRWKGLYCETECNLYLINNNVYCPSIKQNLAMNVIEESLSKVANINNLNPYQLTSTNMNSVVFKDYNVFSALEIVYDSPTKSKWTRFWSHFWKSWVGHLVAVVLAVIALIVAIFTQTWGMYLIALGSVAATLVVVGIITGILSKKVGKGFWNGFANYLNENWAQTLAIEMAIFIVIVGASKLFERITDCFIAGTLVLTSVGLIKIEDIKEGDFVYAYDEKTKKKSLKTVAQIFRNKTKEWVHLFVKNPKTNKIQEIVCTPNHRIYIKNKGWIKTIEILENDKVLLYNGEEGCVISKEIQKLEDYETIYNFEVEELHNYFVGTEKVLVHNDCFPKDSNEIKTGNVKYKKFAKNYDEAMEMGKKLGGVSGDPIQIAPNNYDGFDYLYVRKGKKGDVNVSILEHLSGHPKRGISRHINVYLGLDSKNWHIFF